VIAAGPARDSGHLTTGRGGAREQQRKRGGRNISGGIVENAGETATPAVGFLATKRGRDILGVGWRAGGSGGASSLRWGRRARGTRM
jgi:hypothetical protein